MVIKKALIPIAGLGTRFLPLSKVLPKEFWPLADKPILQYIVKEALASGIKEIVFVNQPKKKTVLNYFEADRSLISILKKRRRTAFIKELEELEKISNKITFRQAFQKKPLGDGHALLQAKKLIGKEPCAVAFADDVIESQVPCFLQLMKIFQKYQKPIVALTRIPKKDFPSYGMAGGKEIAKGVYRLTTIAEKPKIKESPSDLAVVGRYIFTPEIFAFLEKAELNQKGEVILAEVLAKKLKEGKEIYGYEFKGKWLECGNKMAYLKSNLYLSLKHPQFGRGLKEFLKQTE